MGSQNGRLFDNIEGAMSSLAKNALYPRPALYMERQQLMDNCCYMMQRNKDTYRTDMITLNQKRRCDFDRFVY